MDITYYGQACFRLKTRSVGVVIDPFDPDFIGLKLPKIDGDIVCVTHNHKDHDNASAVKSESGAVPFVISGPGEYEKSAVNVVGVASYHDDAGGKERGSNTMYAVGADGITVAHLGDLGQSRLSDEQLSLLGDVDVLLVPVGGVYTITAKQAVGIIGQIEPKIIIPMHFKLPGSKVDLAGVGEFLSEMGAEGKEEVPKLTVTADRLPEETQVVVLAKQ